jgi:hypothetical protein
MQKALDWMVASIKRNHTAAPTFPHSGAYASRCLNRSLRRSPAEALAMKLQRCRDGRDTTKRAEPCCQQSSSAPAGSGREGGSVPRAAPVPVKCTSSSRTIGPLLTSSLSLTSQNVISNQFQKPSWYLPLRVEQFAVICVISDDRLLKKSLDPCWNESHDSIRVYTQVNIILKYFNSIHKFIWSFLGMAFMFCKF